MQTTDWNLFFLMMPAGYCLYSALCRLIFGAGDGIRTRDTKLGKLVLYQLSYARFF